MIVPRLFMGRGRSTGTTTARQEQAPREQGAKQGSRCGSSLMLHEDARLQDLARDCERPTPTPHDAGGFWVCPHRGGRVSGATKLVTFSPSLLRLAKTRAASSVGTGADRARHVAKLTRAASSGESDVVRS